jgi:hypothetical protein
MRETIAVSIIVFAAYAGAALGVTNAFPLSTFPMYADSAPESGARLVVKDSAGEYREVARYEGWSCEPELSYEMVEKTMCPDGQIGQPAGYLSKYALDHIRAHAAQAGAGAGEPIELLIHTWRFEPDTIVELDCPVARCTATLR